MRLTFSKAGPADAPALAALHLAVAQALTEKFGKGHWSRASTERGVLSDMRHAQVWIARRNRRIVATFRLATKKPWAIDRSYFSECRLPLYLTEMAVHPEIQRQSVGRRCVEEIFRITRQWPADAIRLDAYDAEAGAGDFYAKCGFSEVGRVIYRKVPLVYFEKLVKADA